MRLAVVGCGLIGKRRAEMAHHSGDDQVVVVADIATDRASQLGSDLGADWTVDWSEAVERKDVDAVIVSTTHDQLAQITRAAVTLGRHVLVEKPMARNTAEARFVLDALSGSPNSLVAVGFNHRFHPAIRRAREVVQSGGIGQPMFARCKYGHGGRPGYEREWRMRREVSGGGELLDQGMHAIDLFRWFLGEFSEAIGFTGSYAWKTPAALGESVEDNAFALFRTSTSQIASLHASWTQWKNVFTFEVFGASGYVIVNGLGGSYGPEHLIVGTRRPESGRPIEERTDFSGPDDSWSQEWESFKRFVRGGHDLIADADDGLRALQMVEAVYTSESTGTRVTIPTD